jgi:EAL domain-containing protein (putative c-di-GMP-specific phosphodiesterase class I)
MSALLEMQQQPFETLKLEREAIEHLLAGGHAPVVCESIIALAHRLGLSVVAEGVTVREQYEFLLRAGCDAGQGYWFDEPLDQEVFEQRLRDSVQRP